MAWRPAELRFPLGAGQKPGRTGGRMPWHIPGPAPALFEAMCCGQKSGLGVLGVVLWVIVWAPWARGRRTAYRRPVPPEEEVVTTRRYPAEGRYEDGYPPR
jgi:hypothetical protein